MCAFDPVDGGVASDGITLVPSFVKTGELFEKLKLGISTGAETHRQNSAIRNLIFVGPCIIIQLIKTTNVMQHVAFVFITPVVALYMFRVLFAPIIRSV